MILVTGGCGFIGSPLVETLIDRGHRVVVIDDLSTGSLDNVEHLVANPAFGHTIGTAWGTLFLCLAHSVSAPYSARAIANAA